jgi:hypothetical protein
VMPGALWPEDVPRVPGGELYRIRLNAELARHMDGICYLQLQGSITDAQASEMVDRALLVHESLLLGADFPCFRVWREDICGRVRYIARAQHAGAQPHTLVTADVAELRQALIGGPS